MASPNFVPVSFQGRGKTQIAFVLFDERDTGPLRGLSVSIICFRPLLELVSRRIITNEAHLSYQKLLFSELEIVRRNMDRVLEIAEKTYYQRVGLTVILALQKQL